MVLSNNWARANRHIFRLPERYGAWAVVIGFALSITWGLCGISLWHSYFAALSNWTSIAETGALMARAFSAKTMAATELVLKSMLDWVAEEDVQTPEEFDRVFGERSYYDKIRDRLANLDQVDVATFISTTGRIVNFSRSFPPPPINLADRDYFRSQMGERRPATSLGNVVKSRGSGLWTFYQAKQVVNRQGMAIGVVIVGIQAKYFADFFRLIVPGNTGSITFWRMDGTVLSTDTMAEDQLGITHLDATSRQMIDQNPEGATKYVSGPSQIIAPSRINQTDEQKRLLVVRPLSGVPAYVTVRIGADTIFAQWRSERNVTLAIATIVSIALLLSAWMAARSRAEFRRRQTTELQQYLLRAVIEMPLTLSAVLDLNGKVLLSSQGFDQFFRPSSGHDLAMGDGAYPIMKFVKDKTPFSTLQVHVTDASNRRRTFQLTMAKQTLIGFGQCTIVTGTDETDHQATQLAINQSAKMIMLGEMATGMAHELNQPINIIHMAAQNALFEIEPDEPAPPPTSEMLEFVKSKLDIILSETRRAAELIAHMRIFGRSPVETAAAFDARQACVWTLNLIGEQIRLRGIAIHTDLGEQPAMVLGHQTLLDQVLINLLLNARDALSITKQTEKEISIRCHAGDQLVTIEVADNGPGIPQSIRDRIFDPFFTTKEVGHGTGLGLSISYGIVKDMRGSIIVAPSNQGATIRIELPVAGTAPCQPDTAVELRYSARIGQ